VPAEQIAGIATRRSMQAPIGASAWSDERIEQGPVSSFHVDNLPVATAVEAGHRSGLDSISHLAACGNWGATGVQDRRKSAAALPPQHRRVAEIRGFRPLGFR